jgi:predicted small lipoprotein YifL
MRSFLLLALLVALTGCAGQGGRYQFEAAGNTVYRMDTQTGALEACGFESSKPVCWPFPPPPTKN